MGTAMLLRELSKNKGKERIISHVSGTFLTPHLKGRHTCPKALPLGWDMAG